MSWVVAGLPSGAPPVLAVLDSKALSFLPFLTPAAWDSESLSLPRTSHPQMLCAPGLSPPYNHRKESWGEWTARSRPCILHVLSQDHPHSLAYPSLGPLSTGLSPQGTNCLGRGLVNRSPSGARVGWPRAREGGRPLSYCLQTPAVEIGIPDSRERPLQPPGAGPSPGLLPRKGPSRLPAVPTATLRQAPGFPPAECGPQTS